MTLIKIVLVIGVLGIAILLVRHHGTNRGGAYAKIGLGVFLLFAAYAVIRPEDVTWVAGLLGVGRGADLVLYLLVIGFGFFAISTYLRFKELELRIARLARALAVSEARQRDQALATDGERSSATAEASADEAPRSSPRPRK
jgi:hypothetical protein